MIYFFDEDDLKLREFLASHLRPSDPEEAAFLPYMGDCLLQPPTLGGDPDPEEAPAAFPLFIGDFSAQPPTLSGSMEAASAFPQFIGDFPARPLTLGRSMEASSAFPYHNGNGECSALPPAMSSMEEAAHFAPSNAPFDPFDDVFELDALLEPLDNMSTPGGELSPEQLFQFAADVMEGNDQWRLGAGGAQPESSAHLRRFVTDTGMMPWTNQCDANPPGTNQTAWLSQFDADSLLGTNQTTIESSAAGTDQVVQEIPYSNMPALDYPQPLATAAAAVPVLQAQHMLDNEVMEMAELSRVASECGDEASMVWSPDEDKLLLDGLSRLANQDSVSMCIQIAYGLPKKTAMDVAMRIRWFQSKNKSAAQTGVISKESAGGKTKKAQAGVRSKGSAVRKTRKGKGIENPNMKRNKHAPSERVQYCKSTKALIQDNSRLMDRIDDKLNTGQLGYAPAMFNDVKTNMDAILAKMREMSVSTDEYKIDLEALEEITRGFHPSSDK